MIVIGDWGHLSHLNLLYTADRKVFVLDWEFAHAGIVILDFSIHLSHQEYFVTTIITGLQT